MAFSERRKRGESGGCGEQSEEKPGQQENNAWGETEGQQSQTHESSSCARRKQREKREKEEEAVVRTGVTMDRWTLDSNTRKEVAGASRQIRSVTKVTRGSAYPTAAPRCARWQPDVNYGMTALNNSTIPSQEPGGVRQRQ